MRELYELCPRFDRCSAPKCPLDSQFHVRAPRQPGEEKCNVRKSIRLRIVKENPGYTLQFGGYTGHEFSYASRNLNGETS